MDHEWLSMRASYMDFNVRISHYTLFVTLHLCGYIICYFTSMWNMFHPYHACALQTVMKATRRQLERELLMDDVTRLEDMPSYGLLSR